MRDVKLPQMATSGRGGSEPHQNRKDEVIGANLTKLRGNMSMDMLAAKMNSLGNHWSKSTVYKVEHGDRQLRLSEAIDVLKCLDLDWTNDLRLLVIDGIEDQSESLCDDGEKCFADIARLAFDLSYIRGELEKVLLQEVNGGEKLNNSTRERIKRFLSHTTDDCMFRYLRDGQSFSARSGLADETFTFDTFVYDISRDSPDAFERPDSIADEWYKEVIEKDGEKGN